MKRENILSCLSNERKFINEFVSAMMVMIVAFLPGAMVANPDSYGKAFKLFGAIELAFLPVLLIFNIFIKCFADKTVIKDFFSEWVSSMKNTLSANRHFILLFLAFALSFISSCVAYDTQRAFFGTDFRPDGFYMYSVFAAVFVYGSNLRSSKLKKAVYIVYIVSFIINGLVMLQQYIGVIGSVNADSCPEWLWPLKDMYDKYGIRTGLFYKGLTGCFYNSNHMGYFLMICSLIISGWFVIADKTWAKITLAVLCVFSIWLLIVNNTFGCYIALFAGLVLMTVLCMKKTVRTKPLLNIFIPVAVFVVLSIGMSISGDMTVVSNFIKLEDDVRKISQNDEGAEDAGSGRWELWVATGDMIERKPGLGYGPDNVNKEYEKYGLNLTRAHSEYLEHPLNCGIPFAVFYLSGVFYVIFRRIKRMNTPEEAQKYLIPLVSCTAYMVSAFFGVFLFYTACHFFVMLSLLKD